MPIQIIVPEGVLTPSAEADAFRKLTELLLRLHGLTGNTFMTPNVIGEVTVAPKGRTFSGGKPTEIAIFELKVPSFVLAHAGAQGRLDFGRHRDHRAGDRRAHQAREHLFQRHLCR